MRLYCGSRSGRATAVAGEGFACRHRIRRLWWSAFASAAVALALLAPAAWASVGLVKDINPGSADSNPSGATNVNGTLFFAAADGSHGIELWKSNGTSAGTTLVKDINRGGDSHPSHLTNVNGTLFFSADDGTHGVELWKSDGTAAGTTMVNDIKPGSAGSSPNFFAAVNGTLYFQADDGIHGQELWKSDGSAAGTTLVKDIDPGSASGYPNSLKNVDGTLYFQASDGVHGSELWKSDGTAAGTTMVKDINPGSASSLAFPGVSVNGIQYFQADDGTHGAELWRTDGTAAGTSLVKDLLPGSESDSSFPKPATSINGTLYLTAYDGAHYRLWKSDGTAAGTTLVTSAIAVDPGRELVNVNGTLYLAADDGSHGTELWKSDGTAGGTSMVADIRPGSSGSNPHFLTDVNGTLAFAASDGVHGTELWQSDGTAAGTTLVDDINPGSPSSDPGGAGTQQTPGGLTDVNGTVFFAADDGTHGYEPWKWTTVTQQPVTITTYVSDSDVTLGGAVHDNATLSGGSAPTGTVTFRLYGPDDPACSNAPAYTSPAVSQSGDGDYDYDSPDFTPTAAGTYRWIASYSGDASNAPASGTCNDSGEQFTVSPASSTSVPSGLLPLLAATVSGASETNKAFREPGARAARRRTPVGTTFRYTLDAPAAVRFDFTQTIPGRRVNGRCVARASRNKPGCTRTVTRGTLDFSGHAGVNTVKFYGWLTHNHKLKPGKYTLVITATAPGVGSTSQKLRFTIVR